MTRLKIVLVCLTICLLPATLSASPLQPSQDEPGLFDWWNDLVSLVMAFSDPDADAAAREAEAAAEAEALAGDDGSDERARAEAEAKAAAEAGVQ